MPAEDYQDQRCAPAQSQKSPRGDSAGKAGRDHRAKRFGQILARLRYALCRGPAALRRKPFRLCAAISRSDGKAGCRFHRGPFARHRHRTAQRGRESALDHRDHDGNLRLSARSLFSGRSAARSRDRRSRFFARPPQQIVDQILAYPPETKIILLAPLVQNQSRVNSVT